MVADGLAALHHGEARARDRNELGLHSPGRRRSRATGTYRWIVTVFSILRAGFIIGCSRCGRPSHRAIPSISKPKPISVPCNPSVLTHALRIVPCEAAEDDDNQVCRGCSVVVDIRLIS